MDVEKVKLSEKNCENNGEDGVIVSNVPIRTLSLGPVQANMGDQIKVYFEQIGPVNSVEIQQQNNSDIFFANVEFKLAETAAAVLSVHGMHRINDCDVKVKAVEPWHQPDHILNALDDDCLRAILLELTVADLANAANVCIRFNQQAKAVFSTKFKNLDLIECSHKETEILLTTFGSLAQSIDLESKYEDDIQDDGYEIEILTMIAQCCTPILKELTINTFGFEQQLPDDVTFDAALSKLEILSLNDCYLQNSLTNLVSACGELKVLYIDCCSQFALANSDWCIPKFNQLEELHLSEMAGLSELFLSRIIALNSTLKVLSMVGTVQSEVDLTEIFGTIVQKLPNLLELEFHVPVYDSSDFKEILRCLGGLTSLKVLKLDLNGRSAEKLISVLIKNGNPIEHMQLFNGTIDAKAITNIAQMKQLKVLGLIEIDGLTDEHMIQLANGLGSKLEKLHLEGATATNLTIIGLKDMLSFATKLSLLTLKSTTITIDADDYKTMLATVQERPEKNTLSIELTSEGGRVKVDEIVLLKHRDIFYIDEKNDVVEMNYDSDDSLSYDSE